MTNTHEAVLSEVAENASDLYFHIDNTIATYAFYQAINALKATATSGEASEKLDEIMAAVGKFSELATEINELIGEYQEQVETDQEAAA